MDRAARPLQQEAGAGVTGLAIRRVRPPTYLPFQGVICFNFKIPRGLPRGQGDGGFFRRGRRGEGRDSSP